MGKTGKWFRSLFSSKKPPPGSYFSEAAPPSKELKKSKSSPYIEGVDANKHAMAVAAATAVVAEAALAAAQAAAEVVRLTRGAGGSGVNIPAYISRNGRRVAAALKIQSAFRAYLARRALRALKGLVKLQALVRGRIVRKQTADMLRRMQAMARIQARASAYRTHTSNTNLRRPPGVASTRNYHQRSDNAKHSGGYISKQMPEYGSRSRLPSNWLNNWMEQYSWNNGGTLHGGDDERSDKILEIDTWKPRQTPRRSDGKMGREHSRMGPNPSVSSEEASSMISGDQIAVQTSPMVHSASSRQSSNVRGPFTPTRSECLFGEYLGGHPNFMANTESSRAKVRSQSAPKQRMQLDGVGRSSTFGRSIWESDAVSEKGFALPTNYRTAYLKRQCFRKYVE